MTDEKEYVYLAYSDSINAGYMNSVDPPKLLGVYKTRAKAKKAHPPGPYNYYVKTEVK